MSEELCQAVRTQNFERVIALLDRGDDINFRVSGAMVNPQNQRGCTPIQLADCSNYQDIFEVLLAQSLKIGLNLRSADKKRCKSL
jgi:hypothetical protein